MLPNDIFNKGRFITCFRETMSEPGGFRNLWKGFSAHFLTVVILLSALPTATDYMMQIMAPIERKFMQKSQGNQNMPLQS